ncbi:uncharacterized protein LOC125596325 [Brassica napus]|uniref:uncharacterized protein LOC125596325 n=1 Tax=Brassica napus TaxID=3708 RepID=UPI002078780B|nr:uncharacterized protein LOC125596325 [Brassica napus]
MVKDRYRVEEPNFEAQKFYDMLDAAKQPLYDGCRDGISPLSAATRMMSIKTDYNLSEDCVDAIAGFVKDILPEDNLSPATYYEIQNLVSGLGLPYQMIDVCIDNCMLYWRRDVDRTSCRFCHKPRFQKTSRKTKIPYKRMWYLPITDRLKRLYQSKHTADAMRWHGEHNSNGEIAHPSDAKAWQHFQSVYPSFASERRNVYLGLSTDGFNPFGSHGRQYSLWPVIVTPYNLPPSLCMKREFLFLTILVPGPAHPKRSLDVYLQPLIHELKMLWAEGVEVYDISARQNFIMRAVLMWTISDFPAYGIRYLPHDHPYRKSTTLFTKNKKVFDGPPPEIDGKSILTELRDFGVESTAKCGGNGHDPVYGYGEHHNWHKKSIFWKLPYWENHLLRHNLDVMHIEKNIFDNIMNTILNVKGKMKDNLKSILDFPDICARESLHVDGRGRLPMPIYRLDAAAKQEFFDWIIDSVKLPDGYASNLRNYVNREEGKFSGLKSHDCHVMMQRLLPFCFAGLLPKHVHEAGIAAFFRDLCSRSLTADGIRNLKEMIPIIQCNVQKIFPPFFFDVMEHLPIHLPREAELGGPVQYRWMIYMEQIRGAYPNYTEDQLSALKENEFVNWLKFYVRFLLSRGDPIQPWLEELALGPKFVAVSYPMYCTRGYAFKIFSENTTQPTINHGISARSGEVIYYGILREILEIHYPGILNLRCVAFFADWYNPIVGYGVRIDEFGVTSVHSRRSLANYDPFILASQADQKLEGVSDTAAMQQSSSSAIGDLHVDGSEIDLVVDFTGVGDNEVFSDSESEKGEFNEDSVSSEYSSNSD